MTVTRANVQARVARGDIIRHSTRINSTSEPWYVVRTSNAGIWLAMNLSEHVYERKYPTWNWDTVVFALLWAQRGSNDIWTHVPGRVALPLGA